MLQLFGLLACTLSPLTSWQRLLRPDDDSCTPHGSLGKVLAISLLHNQGLDLVQRPSGSSLHGYGGPVLAWLERAALFDGDREAFVVRGGSDGYGLLVDKTSVALGVLVGQVHGVRGEGFG